MILKIHSNMDSGEWTLIDDVHRLTYDTTRITITLRQAESLHQALIDQEIPNLWPDTELLVLHSGWLVGTEVPPELVGQWATWFDSDGNGHAAFTDKPMWLMNDAGETIESLR